MNDPKGEIDDKISYCWQKVDLEFGICNLIKFI